MSNPAQHHKITYIEFTTTTSSGPRSFTQLSSAGASRIGVRNTSTQRRSRRRHRLCKGRCRSKNSLSMRRSLSSTPADLKATEAAIIAAGGSIVVPTFEFPGGRRFHFSDGAGNVLGVWSE